jgi:hypothetical protein
MTFQNKWRMKKKDKGKSSPRATNWTKSIYDIKHWKKRRRKKENESKKKKKNNTD